MNFRAIEAGGIIPARLTTNPTVKKPQERLLDSLIARAGRYGPMENRRTEEMIRRLTRSGF